MKVERWRGREDGESGDGGEVGGWGECCESICIEKKK